MDAFRIRLGALELRERMPHPLQVVLRAPLSREPRQESAHQRARFDHVRQRRAVDPRRAEHPVAEQLRPGGLERIQHHRADAVACGDETQLLQPHERVLQRGAIDPQLFRQRSLRWQGGPLVVAAGKDLVSQLGGDQIDQTAAFQGIFS